MTDRKYDALIIGGGHNGLVCACYLAGAGLKVRVLERREVVGGDIFHGKPTLDQLYSARPVLGYGDYRGPTPSSRLLRLVKGSTGTEARRSRLRPRVSGTVAVPRPVRNHVANPHFSQGFEIQGKSG